MEALNYTSWEKLNEQEGLIENRYSISEYLDQIDDNLTPLNKESIIRWWDDNLYNVNIHYFDFATPGIAGVALDANNIAVNRLTRMPAEIKMFITLHESRHTYHYSDMNLNMHYFETVANGEKENFLDAYARLEADANNFAFNSCEEIGITFPDMVKRNLIRNEEAGNAVYSMMRRDIQSTGASDFKELLLSQII
jgi:hypothetical protein